MSREENMVKPGFALLRFASSAIGGGSDVPGLSDALIDYKRTFFEYEAYSKIFKSVPRSHKLYNEAQFNASMCDLISLLRNPKPYANREEVEAHRIASSLGSICSGVAAKKTIDGEDTYRMFLCHALSMANSIMQAWIGAGTYLVNNAAKEQQSALIRAKRLQDAGISDYAAIRKVIDDSSSNAQFIRGLVEKLNRCFGTYFESLLKRLAENLRNPDTLGKEILDLLIGYANTIEQNAVVFGNHSGLEFQIKSILDKNRKKLLEERYASPEYKEKVKAYWEDPRHSSTKAEYERQLSKQKNELSLAEKKVRELRDRLAELSREHKEERQPINDRIAEIKEWIDKHQSELDSLGFFAFGRKKELRDLISQAHSDLEEQETALAEAEAAHDAKVKEVRASIEAAKKEQLSISQKISSIKDKLEHPPV